MRKTIVILISVLSQAVIAQTFEVDQLEQLFRPRLRTDVKYIFDSGFRDTSSVFSQKEAVIGFTFPLRTRLSADMKLDLSSLKLKDILQNSIRIHASQTLGMFRINTKQAYFGFDSLPSKTIINATAGVLGVRLTRRYRVMFYSFNVTIAEQDKTLSGAVPRFSGLIGQLHPRGLKRNFFYGLAGAYSDGLPIPVPFFGGSQPLGKRFIFNYTLPVQINLQYRDENKTVLTVGVSLDGYRSGIRYTSQRLNFNYTSAVAYSSVRIKITKEFVARAEAGYIFYQNIRYDNFIDYRSNFPITPGPYIQAGFNILFGQTLWEKMANELFRN
jgi:hypothetical protein